MTSLNWLMGQGFMPHGHCYQWTPWILWPNVLADIAITLAYYSIPIALVYFVRRRPDVLFHRMFLLFAAFIFACGTTHLLEVYNVWNSAYGLAALVKMATALASGLCAIFLWSIIPKALLLKSPADLARIIDSRTDALRESEDNLSKYRDRLKALAARLEEIREEERTRISRELHDQLGQELTILKIGLSTAADTLAEPGLNEHTSAVHRQLKGNIANVDASIKSVRRIASQLRPPILDGLGLAAALEWHVEEFARKTGLSCTFENMSDGSPQEDPNHATALFRAAQELLTNIARHAQASCVHVTLTRSDLRTVLELVDNGIGISNAESPPPNSMGLLGIRERVISTGGTFEISRHDCGGTKARIEIAACGTEGTEQA